MGEGHVPVRVRMWFMKSSLSVMPVVVMLFVLMDVVMFFLPHGCGHARGAHGQVV